MEILMKEYINEFNKISGTSKEIDSDKLKTLLFELLGKDFESELINYVYQIIKENSEKFQKDFIFLNKD